MESSAKKPTVIITGASGMLGKALTKIAAASYHVVGVSRRAMPGGVVCDLVDKAQVEKLLVSQHPSLVIHGAAYSDVDGCERDPKQAHDCNVLATKNLSEVCAAQGVPWIYVSTDYVFDGPKTTPYAETDATCPVNIYGLTKWGGEFYALNSAVSSAVVRTSWLFGPEHETTFVNAILTRLKNDKKLAVLDDQTDSPTHVKDLSQALLTIGRHLMTTHAKDPKKAWHDIFQVCNTGATTRYAMTVFMKECLGLKDVVVEKTDRSQIKNRIAIRAPYLVMSTKHYEQLFGVKLRSWQESLKEYVLESH